MSDDSKQQKIDELKYEGLAALIQTNKEQEEARWDLFFNSFTEFKVNLKEDITELKNYNKTQNGRQATMMGKIAELESESQKRKLTCMRAVEVLEKKAEDEKEEKKKDTEKKLSKRQWIALFVVSVTVGLTAIGGFVISIINLP